MRIAPVSLVKRSHVTAAPRILQAAEDCFGEHGIDAVSLRQIAIAAGQGNTAAVQYHFGSKEGLLEAIFQHRLPAIDQRRKALIETLDPQQRTQVRSLLKIIFQPIWEIRNAQGRPSYALFLRRLNNTTGMPPEWRRAADRAPVTSQTVNYLRHCMSDVSPAAQDFRILLVTSLILDAFWKADTVRSDGIAASLLISTALDMSCAAIQCAESEAPEPGF
ncbi:MAG TPA: helix-turn-helix domain-containing protein [Rhizorhapis sp.]